MTPHSFRTFRMPIRIATCIALAVLGACTSPPVRFHTLGMAMARAATPTPRVPHG